MERISVKQVALLALGAGALLAALRFLAATAPSPPALAAPATPRPPGSMAAIAVAALSSPATINPQDYVGPARCTECHKEKFAAWEGHPHRRMNQDATPASVKGDFSGVTIAYSSGTATFATEPEGYTMTLRRDDAVLRRYVVTRVVGSRFMQFYIGRQVAGPDPADSKLATEEHKLSFGYWFKRKQWLP